MRLLSSLLLVGLLLSGCASAEESGSPGPVVEATTDETDGPTAEAAPRVAVGTLAVSEGAAALTMAGTAESTPVASEVEVAEGDEVRTDELGFAQVTFLDGSVTRLAADTVVALSAAGGAELGLGSGHVWSVVAGLTDADPFDVVTAAGTASAREARFVVGAAADGSVHVSVFEGEASFSDLDGAATLIGPGHHLRIAADGSVTGPVQALPLTGEPFVLRNLAIDQVGDDPAAMDVEATPDELAGDYTVRVILPAPWEFDTQRNIDDYEGDNWVDAYHGGQARGLPRTVGSETTGTWTLSAAQYGAGFVEIGSDAFPGVTSLGPTTTGYGDSEDRIQSGSVSEGCEATEPSLNTTYLTLHPTEKVDGVVTSFVATMEWAYYAVDTGAEPPPGSAPDSCLQVRHTGRFVVVGTRNS